MYGPVLPLSSDSGGSLVPREAARELRDLVDLSDKLGTSLTRTFVNGAIQGKRLDDTLRQMARSFVDISLKAAMAPLQQSLSRGVSSFLEGAIGSLAGSIGGGGGGGGGGGVPLPPIRPFAKGGIVAAPSYFPMPGAIGLMGERGAEAILPLARGADGRLGVAAPGGDARPISVHVHVSTPDAESFRRSEAQVAAAIARAVARGRRAS